MGIMNGTTNFMLCQMEEGTDYAAVLAEAQRLGFAEADPTADVEGHDVQAKIALLAKLAFGVTVPVEAVPCSGISRVSVVDFEYAKIMRSTIKLLGTASRNADGSVAVFVSPAMVPLNGSLAAARGPGNTVLIHTENMGAVSFAGPGAGRFPTANSVVADIIRLATGQVVKEAFPLEDGGKTVINNDYSARFYLRVRCSDGLGIIRAVGQAAENCNVSINAILQNPIVDPKTVDFAIVTEEVKLSAVRAFAREIAAMPFAVGEPLYMNILLS